MTLIQMEREVRLLKIYAAAATTFVVALLLAISVRGQGQRQKFGEIDVERINIVDSDGKLALVIANRQRLPGPIVEGKELPPALSQGRAGAAGMIFVDVQGNEVGGLVYRATVQSGGGYAAGSSLTFDQHNQDQVVGLSYTDDGTARNYGLSVWDRPTKIAMKELLNLPPGTIEQRFMALARERGETVLGPRRVFVGSQDRIAAVRLMDTAGRERFRVTVDSTNTPRMDFVDDTGKVVYSLPPRQ